MTDSAAKLVALPPPSEDTMAIDRVAEASVLGALLVTRGMDAVLGELHLAAEHFWIERHRLIFASMVALHEQGRAIDSITVRDELRRRGELEKAGGVEYVSGLASRVPAPGNFLHHARIVIEKAEWRLRLQASELIREAVVSEDRAKLATAEELLAKDLVHVDSRYDSDRLADVAYALMDGALGKPLCGWPFGALDNKTAGGLRRGQLIYLGGYTSHGKSAFLDQVLEGAGRRGLRVQLYINEMTVAERTARFLSHRTEVPFSAIISGNLSDRSRGRLLEELNRGFPFEITPCPGWTADEIAHDLRANRYDVAAIDMVHRIEYQDERDLARISSVLASAAQQADCALIGTVHLNENRAMKATRDRPVLGDIKGSGSLKYDADAVLFVFREQDSETGEPLEEGAIWFAKVRNGGVGGMKARFNARRMRFEARGRQEELA